VLGIAERELPPERELLGHIGVDVLAGLGDGAVKRPERHIPEEDHDHRALAPGGVGERIEQPLDARERAAAPLRLGRHCKHPVDPYPGGSLWHDVQGRSISSSPWLCRIRRRC
jgi:hypothetical protein